MDKLDAKSKATWDEYVNKSIDDQATAFLKAFVLEFGGGRFEEVLEIASQFRKFAVKDACDLEEQQAHLFLEKRDETLTVAELRKYLKEIDFDNNRRTAFLEYALWKWKKTPSEWIKELDSPKKGGTAALEAAIAAYRAVIAAREAREAKMAELEKIAADGGVKGSKAKHELEQMKSECKLAANKAEITAGARKRAAEKNAVDPFEEEQKRLAAEKAKKEAEDKKKAEDARARLKAKSSMWEQGGPK